MILQLFRPPNDGEKLRDCKLGDINDALSLEYDKYFCGVGTFTLELPVTSKFAGEIEPNVLIYDKDNNDCFIVKNVLTDAEKVKVTGYDLNGLLLDRITLPNNETDEAGTDGKDGVAGTTEFCAKHYVRWNLIESDFAQRNIPRLVVADDNGRGEQDDSYLATYECVEDVVRKLCESAGLGYRISMDTTVSSETNAIFTFDVAEQVDRTAGQSENNRVILSAQMKNIGGIEREVGITAEKNALWCETSLLSEFVNKNADEIPTSWDRREDYVSLSVIDDTQEYVEAAAKQEFDDKFAETDSLTVDAGNPLDYGVLYNLGDIVTVYDKDRTLQLDSVISAATIKRTATEYTVKLTLGDSKPKLLDGYAKKSELLTKNQREYPAVKIEAEASSNITALTEYKYLTDSSVAMNGTTYTIEKDDSGLISLISDSNGNSFSPESSGEITDIALHNAVFWAAAMIKGLPQKTMTEQQFILSVCAQGDTDTYPVIMYMLNETNYAAELFKSSYTLGFGLSVPIRGTNCLSYSFVSSDGYQKITGAKTTDGGDIGIDRWADSPLSLKTGSGGQGYKVNNFDKLYVSVLPSSMAGFYQTWLKAGIENDLTEHRLTFKDVYTFDGAGAPTGAMYYRWNNMYLLDFYYSGGYCILDGTNSRLDRGTCKIPTISNNLISSGYYTDLGTSKITLSCSDSNQYGTSYYSTLRNNLEDNIFLNTEDICDENGNVLLGKNCDLSFFI